MHFQIFSSVFELYHSHPFTICVHMASLIVSTVYITQLLPEIVINNRFFVNLVYSGYLLSANTDHRLVLSTVLFINGCVKYVTTSISFTGFALSLFAQYLSHVVVRQDPLLVTYMNIDGFLQMYLIHVLFTIPSVLHLFVSRILFPSNEVIVDKIHEKNDHCTYIQEWVRRQIDATDQSLTHHWWYDDVSDFTQHHVSCLDTMVLTRIKYITSMMYNIASIDEMNEIYVSSNRQLTGNSDNVFYSKHIDAPFYLFPLCSVKRVILAVNKNDNITTVFPHQNLRHMLSNGDFACFDFNRDIHYIISKNNQPDEPRITLKLHYVVYPRGFYWMAKALKRLNVAYDKRARDLFLYTRDPQTVAQKVAARTVNWTTYATYYIEEYIGFYNLLLGGLVYLM